MGDDSKSAQRRAESDDGGNREESTGHGFCLRRTVSTSVSPFLDIYSVDSLQDKHSLNIIISVKHNQNNTTVETPALINSGAGGTFIDQNYARKIGYKLTELETPVKAYNVDGMENKKGMIKNYIDLQFSLNGKEFQERFYVTGLGKQKVILGLPWLRKHNPEINWQTGTLKWQIRSNLKRFFIFRKKEKTNNGQMANKTSKSNLSPTVMEEVDEEEFMNRTINALDTDDEHILETIQEYHQGVWINKTNMATKLAMAENLKKKTLPLEEMIPKEFHEYLDIFDKQKAN